MRPWSPGGWCLGALPFLTSTAAEVPLHAPPQWRWQAQVRAPCSDPAQHVHAEAYAQPPGRGLSCQVHLGCPLRPALPPLCPDLQDPTWSQGEPSSWRWTP